MNVELNADTSTFAMNLEKSQGSIAEFKANWQRPEAEYCHFTRGEPENQIQFAFRQNWLEFSKIMEQRWPRSEWCGKQSLEIGAGRGTMSMYLQEHGFSTVLLDICSAPLRSAKEWFHRKGLECTTYEADALDTGLPQESYDMVFSYGLLEHLDDIESAIAEQVRLLIRGGLFIAYVVPHEANAGFGWCNLFNRVLSITCGHSEQKKPVYRNNRTQNCYIKCANELGLINCDLRRVYTVPMIGQCDFPATVNPPEAEKEIVKVFSEYVNENGWCTNRLDHQAFIVWGWKR